MLQTSPAKTSLSAACALERPSAPDVPISPTAMSNLPTPWLPEADLYPFQPSVPIPTLARAHANFSIQETGKSMFRVWFSDLAFQFERPASILGSSNRPH